MKICFATGNMGKLKEASEILGEDYELYTSAQAGITEDIQENGSTFVENSRIKADYIWERIHSDCFADDSGLEVDALGGAPGIYSARYGSDHDFEKNIDKVLDELSALGPGVSRKARFRCVVTLIHNGEHYVFEGTTQGSIGLRREGHGGFGYDPVFVPDILPVFNPDGSVTLVPNKEHLAFAQYPQNGKNTISHRGQALRRMAEFLRSLE